MQIEKEDAVRNVVLALVVVMFLTSARGILPAQSNVGSAESRNKAIVEASFRAWSSGTGSPYDLLTEQCDLDDRWPLGRREDI